MTVIAFGLYTICNTTLKLSSQLYPLYPEKSREVHLDIKKNGDWETVNTQTINDLGRSAMFRVLDRNTTKNINYRLRHDKNATYEGSIRKDPSDTDEFSIAALYCNSNKDCGMRENYVRNINHQNPDLIFFAGDQSYDHTDHTAAWLKFGLQFRETFRHRPCITIADNYDIGQGNLLGKAGKFLLVKEVRMAAIATIRNM